MVSIDDTWKLANTSKFEIYNSEDESNPYEEILKTIEENKKVFVNESKEWLDKKVIDENEFRIEQQAREALVQSLLLYAKHQERFFKWNKIKPNYPLTVYHTFEEIKKELDRAVNKIFTFDFNGQKIIKKHGETMEHYLMRGIILQFLHQNLGVKEFYEEYSKLDEILNAILESEGKRQELWKKVAKRADLYVVLSDGTKLWIEIERSTSNQCLNEKIQNVKNMADYYPELFDQVLFVFPDMIQYMALATLIEANKIGFPTEKLAFYEVNLRTNQILHGVNLTLAHTEFGDGLLDMIADGYSEVTGKTALLISKKIQEKIIIPLLNNQLEQQWIVDRKHQIQRLITFWRKRTNKFTVRSTEVEFKIASIQELQKKYPYLFTPHR